MAEPVVVIETPVPDKGDEERRSVRAWQQSASAGSDDAVRCGAAENVAPRANENYIPGASVLVGEPEPGHPTRDPRRVMRASSAPIGAEIAGRLGS